MPRCAILDDVGLNDREREEDMLRLEDAAIAKTERTRDGYVEPSVTPPPTSDTLADLIAESLADASR